MPALQARLNGTFEALAQAIEAIRIRMACQESLVYEHTDGNRPHCHLYLFDAAFKIDTLRTACRQFLAGNTDFACSATAGKRRGSITLDGAVRYGSRNGELHFKRQTGMDDAKLTEIENTHRKTKVAVKPTYYQQLIKDFDEEEPEWYKQVLAASTPDDVYAQWKALKRICHQWAFEHNGAIWSPKTAQEYRCLVMTNALRNGIPIDRTDKISA